jgi:outer membrane usher protein
VQLGQRQWFRRLLSALVSGVAALAASQAYGRASPADEISYARPVSSKLNVTGRAINMSVPLKEDDRPLDEVIIRINPDDSVLVSKAGFTDRIRPLVDGPALERISSLPTEDGFLSLAALSSAGFDLQFDPALQELCFRPAAEQRPVGDLTLGSQRPPRISANLAQPAFLSGYFNIFGGVDYVWNTSDYASRSGKSVNGRLDFESAIRVGDVVFENRALYAAAVDGDFCPTAAPCTYGDTAGFRRQSSRLIYDMPDRSMRLEIGDVDPLGAGVQSATEVLGVSLEKSDRKLNPGERPFGMGRSSFRIDLPSDIDVLVNGVSLQRFHLRPGTYNIRDLPLSTGANDIELVIVDDTGDRRTLAFTTFFDGTLLGENESEWGLSVGAPSYFINDTRTYSPDLLMGTGFFRFGVTDDLTALAHLQGNAQVVMGGLGATTQTPWGIFGFGGAASAGEFGAGGEANIDWSLVNFTGFSGRRGESVRVAVEYRSPDFHAPGELVTLEDDRLTYSLLDTQLRLDASYSVPLQWDTTATFAAHLRLPDPEDLFCPFDPLGDTRYGADVTLARAFGRSTSGSLTVGYSNDSFLRPVLINSEADAEGEVHVAARVNFRPDESTSVLAGYDSLNRQAEVSAFRNEGNGLGRWDTSINVQQYAFDDSLAGTATAGYYGNRAEVRVMHSTGLSGVSYDVFNADAGDQRTSLRIGSAVVFADGHVAVGAPVRGGAFALVYPHSSIADKEVSVGGDGYAVAQADSLGPAVVGGLPAYLPSTVAVDVADLPLGYSIGAGAFDTFAPYKGGYKLEVGSAYSVYAYGTLLDADAAPLALQTGIAHPDGDSSRQVAVFTNAQGKFGAEGLAAGKWIIEMATGNGSVDYVIDVPEGTDGLFRAGTLEPESAT